MPFFDEIARRSGQIITFTSIATGDEVSFPAFITQFSDSFNVGWSGETLFGRTDPIKHYTSTTRQINVGFDILAPSKEKAVENFQNYGRLIKMLYPVFSDPVGKENNSRTIKAAPLLRIKYANYIRSLKGQGGLLGCINGISFTPDFAAGHFLDEQNEMIPIKYAASFTFEPMHEEPLGSDMSGEFLEETFPYNQEASRKKVRLPGTIKEIS
mgnify:CR=1 FL=1|tara:strand:- start:2118 stop:2753 length:636 start_codon:yes stop_codon:yes gene_type:complete